ncbi:MAG: porin family protein [Porphyromonadaceae bacterium]|nr:porin family protein [Porphyromonadaceae bacterium]
MIIRIIGILGLISLLHSPLSGQKERVKNRPYADLKPYYLGFGIGIHTQDLRLSNSGIMLPSGETLFAEVPEYRPGFHVGVLLGRVFRPGLELRAMPTLYFGDKLVAYSNGTAEQSAFLMRSTYLSVPLQLKYASLRLNNLRPYVATGLYGSLSLGGKRGEVLRERGLDYGLLFSIGCDLYLRYFTLSPELTFGYGLPNIIDLERKDLEDDKRIYYTQALRGGRTRMIALTLNFH